MQYKLGLDMGTNSIGWCVLRTKEDGEPAAIVKMGSRIFSDGRVAKTGTPLAEDRRTARGMRRNLDRRRAKTNWLMYKLVELGFFPKDDANRKNFETLNPYEIRYKALYEEIPLPHIARALVHISKHRGFKSNRKADKKSKDGGKINPAIKDFKEKLKNENYKTVGEYLYNLNKERKNVRIRLGTFEGKKDNSYEWYIDRSMVKHEFDEIMRVQSGYHIELTQDVITILDKIIFSQRPLKPVEVGKCSQYPEEDRAAKALPICQEFIMLQKIHDLRVIGSTERPLTESEFEILKKELNKNSKLSFGAIRKLLKIQYEFNFETEKDKELKGNVTNAIMADKKHFGDIWYSFGIDKQNAIVAKLLSDDSDEFILSYLKKLNLTDEKAGDILNVGFKVLPDGYMSYSEKAIDELTQLMRNYGRSFHNAKTELCYEDDKQEFENIETLPYYAEIVGKYCNNAEGGESDEEKFVKIANPTVHIALNQLRKLTNAIIDKYGKPSSISIEIGRELKLSQKLKEEYKKEQTKNEKNNERWKKDFDDANLSYDDRQKLKLWEEVKESDRCCIYCGKSIPKADLLSNSVEIEHILPFSRTLDNSLSNKILSCTACNAYKTKKTPYEAFGDNRLHKYDDILERVSMLPKNKRWRFSEDAMERFKEDSSFIARQLTDMQYISKVAKDYLSALYPKNENKVLTIPGKLTALLRDKLGLNKLLSGDDTKNRNDHRHHAIDALVVCLTTRSLLQRVSTLAGKFEEEKCRRTNKLFRDLPMPLDHFHESVKNALDNIKVSHKQDHGVQGRLHEDSSYGIVEPCELGANLVLRKALESLTPGEISMIRDKKIREDVQKIKNESIDDKIFKERLAKYMQEKQIRRVRVLKKDLVVKTLNQKGKDYKALVGGDNFCVEIFEKENGQTDKEIIAKFNANQKGFQPKWRTDYPNAKLKMRLFKGDIISFKEDKKHLCRLVSIANDKTYLLPIKEAGNIKDREKKENKQIYIYKSYNPLFNQLNAKLVHIDIIGNVKKALPPCDDFWLCGGVCNPKKCDKGKKYE